MFPDTSNLSPVLSPILAGRADEVGLLRHRLGQARDSTGTTVLLSGEAGIGKSRLAHEAKTMAAELGFDVLQGNCYEQDRGLPFAPFVDLLRKNLTGLVGSEPQDQSGLPQLLKLAPDLAPQFPDVQLAPVAEPEQEKRNLFRAWTSLLTGLVETRGQFPAPASLLVIEDLHWCDDNSLEFLTQFARAISAQPIVVLLTYRNDEITPSLSHFLAALERERLASEIELKRLTPAETGEVIRAIFDQKQVRDEFLGAIQTLTDGNPFFIEETLKALVSSGDIYQERGIWTRKPLSALRIPRTVQDAVQRRTAQLSEPARAVLIAAAVTGQRFDFALLQAVTQHNERELLALIKQLITAQLVSEADADHFVFRHALTRQAIYTNLLVRERKTLHTAILDAMTALYANAIEPHMAELSYHAHEAGRWDQSLVYSQRAGEKAQQLFAPRAAAEYFSRAIEAAIALPRRMGEGWVGAALHRTRAQAYETLGEFDLARADYETALAATLLAQDKRSEWENLFSLGFLWTARDMPVARDYLERALRAARDMHDAGTLGHSLNRVGNWLLNMNQPLTALHHHQEALGIFEPLGDKAGLAATHDLLGITNMLRTDNLASVSHHAQAAALFRELDNRHGLISTLALSSNHGGNYQSDTSVFAPETEDECWRYGDEAIQIAQQIGWRFGEAMSNMFLASAMGVRGAFARAFGCAQRAMDIALDIDALVWEGGTHMMFGRLYLDVLALPMARLHGERGVELARPVGAVEQLRTAAALLAETLIAQGEWARAAALLAEFPEQLSAETQTVSLRGIVCARAELALAQGDAATALALIEQLIETAVQADSASKIVPRLWHVRGLALHKLNQYDEAERVLQAGAAAAEAQALKPTHWRILVSLGKLHQARRRGEQAQAAFQHARHIVRTLAAELSETDLREGFGQGFEALLGNAPKTTPSRTAKQAFDGLTAREREVAACVAQGMTNKAVAGQLVVSERTVEKHVENAMGKLGFTSRSQLAVWAVEKKIVTTQPGLSF